MTDSTLPCLMLSVMFIYLVCPYLVFNRARRVPIDCCSILWLAACRPARRPGRSPDVSLYAVDFMGIMDLAS